MSLSRLSVRRFSVFAVIHMGALIAMFVALGGCGSGRETQTSGVFTPNNQYPISNCVNPGQPGQGTDVFGCAQPQPYPIHRPPTYRPTFVVPTITYQMGWYDQFGVYCGSTPDLRCGSMLYYYDARSWMRVRHRNWTYTSVRTPGRRVQQSGWGVQGSSGIHFWAGGKFQLRF